MATLAGDLNQKNHPLPNSKCVGTKFTQSVGTLDNYYLEIGDEFTIPDNFKIHEYYINSRLTQYIYVTFKNGQSKQFYPSVFMKTVIEYSEDGINTGIRKHGTGSATKAFLIGAGKYKGIYAVNGGLKALKGKTLRVVNIEYVRTVRYRNETPHYIKVPVYTIDII